MLSFALGNITRITSAPTSQVTVGAALSSFGKTSLYRWVAVHIVDLVAIVCRRNRRNGEERWINAIARIGLEEGA